MDIRTLSRLQKIMALAEGSKNPSEVEVALSKAQSLMETVNLEEWEDFKKSGDLSKIEGIAITYFNPTEYRRRPVWLSILCSGVARGFGCQTILVGASLAVVGPKSTVGFVIKTVTDLVTYLPIMASIALDENVGDFGDGQNRSNRRKFRTTWLMGVSSGISSKLSKRRDEFEASSGRELAILYDREISKAISIEFPTLVQTDLSPIGWDRLDAFSLGFRAGLDLDISNSPTLLLE